MNPHVQDKLCQIVATYGAAIVDDPRRCEGLLRDLCPQDKREVHVLVGALKERIPAELASPAMQNRAAVSIGRLAKRLEDNLAFAEEPARWAVESWALALGVATKQQLAATRPKPRPHSHDVVPPPVIGSQAADGAASPRRRAVVVAISALLALSGAGMALSWNSPWARGWLGPKDRTVQPDFPSVPSVGAEPLTVESDTGGKTVSTPDILLPPERFGQSAPEPVAESSRLTEEELRTVQEAAKATQSSNEIRN